MAAPVGTQERPLRVAVVGSGPSGFYAVEAYYKQDALTVEIDLFDRLPTPYGLVRGGVAPDHQSIKNIARKYHKTATSPGFRFFGNVMLGRDLTVDDLLGRYDQIVYAVGNESDRRMGIPGEDYVGVSSATAFVGWYNGHPDFRHCEFGLDKAKRVVVVGNGNVAMDVSRILARDPEELADTDIADYALEALRASTVTEIVVLGRRGPAQAAFSPKEIKEIGRLETADLMVDAEHVALDPVSQAWMDSGQAPRTAQKNLDFLREIADRGARGNKRQIRLEFLASPQSFEGDATGHLSAVKVVRNELYDHKGTPRPRATDETFTIEAQLAFKAIGYRGVPIEGVPFHEKWGIIPNIEGRVTESADSEALVPRQYVVGWAKRGPTGLIGTNGPDAQATVAKALEDVASLDPDATGGSTTDMLAERGVDYATWDDWERLDEQEQLLGQSVGKLRQKFTSIEAMMNEVRRLRTNA